MITRFADNPILSPDDWPYRVSAVFNPGAALLRDGTTLLLCRVETHDGFSHLAAARSKDGYSNWQIDAEPTFSADVTNFPEEAWGVEDPRIVWLPERSCFAVTYTAYGPDGPGVSLALTADFKQFERLGMILPPEDKDAALLPERIGGMWQMIHRPVSPNGKHIWISQSPDLIHWGRRRKVMAARTGGWWDAGKIGLSTPLIPAPSGWLMVYHGVRETVCGSIYRVGLALLDRDDPSRCIRRSREWLLGPTHQLERTGDVPNVVFPGGYTIREEEGLVRLYFGMADTWIGTAEGRLDEWLNWLEATGIPADVGC